MKLHTLFAVAFSAIPLLVACGSSPDDTSESAPSASEEDIKARRICGGFAGLTCPSGYTCVDNPNDSCDPAKGGRDCSGICEKKPKTIACGGFAGIACPSGYECVDDPSDSCDPAKGGADCGGICQVAAKKIACGGFAGLPCPKGLTCVDDPSDGCDPKKGGADCMGICK